MKFSPPTQSSLLKAGSIMWVFGFVFVFVFFACLFVLLEIPAYLWHSEGRQLLSFMSVPIAVAVEQIVTCCSLGPC